jgi:type IV pilus assembly protein PilA
MKKVNNKEGFTLIELLAVIVVLGIIMLIAVTAVSNVINSSKTNSFKTSAMMVAKQVRNEVLPMGYTNNQTIDCLNGNYGLNPNNYDYCSALVSIIDDNTKVYVDLIGKGNFSGLSIIGATMDSASTINNTTYQVLKDVLLAPANIKGNVSYGDPGAITGGLYYWEDQDKYIFRGGISRTGASLTTITYDSDTVSTATEIANFIKVPWENNSVSCNNSYSDHPCWRIISVNSDGSITIVRDRNVSPNQVFDNTPNLDNATQPNTYGYNDLLANAYRGNSLMYDRLYGPTGYQNTTIKNYYSLLNTLDVCLNKIDTYVGINLSTYAGSTVVKDTCDLTGRTGTFSAVNPLQNQYVRLPYMEEYINASLSSTIVDGTGALCAGDYQYQCRNKNFMYNKQNYWSLNGRASYSWPVRFVSVSGYASATDAYNSLGVRPVVNLKSTILISGGTGTVSDPYIIKS